MFVPTLLHKCFQQKGELLIWKRYKGAFGGTGDVLFLDLSKKYTRVYFVRVWGNKYLGSAHFRVCYIK